MIKRVIQDLCYFFSFPFVIIILMVIGDTYGFYIFAGSFMIFGTILTLIASKLSDKVNQKKVI